jgi:thiosulfate/3-mercaptopyruvate sulfurtransferase
MENTVTISPDRLVEYQQSAKAIALVDCRFSLSDPLLGRQQYEEGHIPGAYYLDLNQDLSSPVQRHGGRHPLPEPSVLAAKLNRMGIAAQTLVVAYDDSRFAFAARLWWLLKYLGHEQVVVLDGGFAAYRDLGLPVTTEIPVESTGSFVPQVQADRVVNLQDIQRRRSTVRVIDCREPERYCGEREPIDPVAGHIPGALNYPWQAVTNESGKLQSPETLKTYWSDLISAEELVMYCGSGVTACVNLLALAAADVPTGKLYAGSWSDWCSYPLDAEGQPIVR